MVEAVSDDDTSPLTIVWQGFIGLSFANDWRETVTVAECSDLAEGPSSFTTGLKGIDGVVNNSDVVWAPLSFTVLWGEIGVSASIAVDDASPTSHSCRQEEGYHSASGDVARFRVQAA